MVNEITIQAKTVEEAITKATIELGVVSSDMGYEVVEKGSAGFLGIGAKQAVIKAYKKADQPVEEKVVEPVKKVEPKKVVEPVKEIKKEIKPEIKKEVKSEVKKEVKPEAIKETKKPQKTTTKKTEPKQSTPRPERKSSEISQEVIDNTTKFIEDVLVAMKVEATVKSTIDADGDLLIEMDGKKMGMLIGKRGQTLDSLQYLASRVANKEKEGYIRVKLDTENYRQRRKETLENLARNIASKVKRTRQSVSLEPMNPYERRIIHSVLQEDKYITTHSEGEEPYRHLVVTYTKNK